MKYQFNSYDRSRFNIYGITGLFLSIILLFLCILSLSILPLDLDVSFIILFMVFYVICVIFFLLKLMKYFKFTQIITFDDNKIEICSDKKGTLSFPLHQLNKVEIFKSKALLNSSIFIRCTVRLNDSDKKIWFGISRSCFSNLSSEKDEKVIEQFLSDFSNQILEHQYEETSGLGIALLQLALNSNIVQNRITFVRK